jgi:cephalosporin hydroxylase
MIEPNIYCKVSGMAMRAISLLNDEGHRLPTVIEIGTAEGFGTMRYAGFCSRVIGVDAMVSGRPDIVSNSEEAMDIDTAKRDAFIRNLQGLTDAKLIIGSSTWPSTITGVREALSGQQADLLIIDGCHHPESAVWRDFELYEPLVRSNGFVIFDDLYEVDIMNCYRRAQEERGYVEASRWGVSTPHILQECGLLRKP